MVRWSVYAAIGALAGAATFFLLLEAAPGLAPFLITGTVVAGTEVILARRVSRAPVPLRSHVILRAALAFVLAAGTALGVCVLLYAGLVAP